MNDGTLQNVFFPLYVQSVSQSVKKNPIYFNTNYCTEMKLVPFIMDYYLLQFDALKFFLGGPSTWGVST